MKQSALPRGLTALLAVVIMLPFPATGRVPSINQQIREQRKKVEAGRLRLQKKRGQLTIAKTRVADFQRQLAKTGDAIGLVNRQLGALRIQVRHLQKRVAWAAVQLIAAREALRLQDDVYKHRLVNIYEHGNLGYLNIMLGAKSYADFVERWGDLRLIVAASQHAIRVRREKMKRVEAIQRTLLLNETAIQVLEQEQSQTRNQLNALAAERRQLVVAADAQRRNLATEVAQLEDVTAEQAAALKSLVVQRQREYEAQQAAEAKRRRDSAIARGEVPPALAPAPRGDNTRALSWPARGPVTSPFGYRYHPIHHRMVFHEGLDIGADQGAPILAAADGRVIVAGWVSGYGNYIGIAHGAGVTTGYGHCSRIFVAVGQDVKRGQAIGAVGSTGNSTGPHLHFEVRVNGYPVDPATRLR